MHKWVNILGIMWHILWALWSLESGMGAQAVRKHSGSYHVYAIIKSLYSGMVLPRLFKRLYVFLWALWSLESGVGAQAVRKHSGSYHIYADIIVLPKFLKRPVMRWIARHTRYWTETLSDIGSACMSSIVQMAYQVLQLHGR